MSGEAPFAPVKAALATGRGVLLCCDIDGTLAPFSTGKISARTVKALDAAGARGVRLAIATGRCRQMLYVLKPVASLVRALILSNGALCEVGGRCLRCLTLSAAVARRVVADARVRHYPCCVVTTRGFSVYESDERVGREFLEELRREGVDYGQALDDLLVDPVLQITPFVSVEEEQRLREFTGECRMLRWHPGFTDITHPDADKGQALKLLKQAMGNPYTIACGDGANDVPMLEAADLGVAMGNAAGDVKARADFVTRTADEDGIGYLLGEILN